jgi:hypothetical protein
VITLHLKKNDGESSRVRELFDELAIARREVYDASSLPAVVDDGRTIEGLKAIENYVDELSSYLGEWQKFQSDACYCNERGEVE